MKNYNLKKIMAAAAAVCLSAAMLSACGKKNDSESSDETSTASETTTASSEEVTIPTLAGLKPVAEGDVFAINKFIAEPLPENIELVLKTQEDGNQTLRYLVDEGKAIVKVDAANYKEEFQSLEVFAENACASIVITNKYYACETEYAEPENVTYAGFDAIRYDYITTQYDFEYDAEGNTVKDENGKEIRNPVLQYKGSSYYFYSDKDVFSVVYETTLDNWDNTADSFDKFTSLVYIDENAVNDPVETEAAVTETAGSDTVGLASDEAESENQ